MNFTVMHGSMPGSLAQMYARCSWRTRPVKHLTKNGVRLVPSGKAPRPPHFWYVLKAGSFLVVHCAPLTRPFKFPRHNK